MKLLLIVIAYMILTKISDCEDGCGCGCFSAILATLAYCFLT